MEDQPKQSISSIPGATEISASDDSGQETSVQQQQVLPPRHERAKGKAPVDSLDSAMEDPQPKKAKFTEASGPSLPGATSSSTSTERCDSGQSGSVDVMEEEFNIFFNQQQQNGRTIPRGQDEDTRRQSDSQPSASYTSVLGNNYYVFLSFRGPDTRKGFSDYLYHRLVDVGLHYPDFVFRDDEELRFGQPLGDNLLDAIERSRISIPVISETYAASEWCLREIIKIMDCVERGQQKVYPVLYKVEPKDVRFMRGKFGDAFRRNQHRFAEEVQQKGPEALKKAVERRIYESKKVASGHEGKFVKELVETIMREQQHEFPPSLPEDLVGIDDHVARVMNLADTASSEARIIVIYGIGGIGKTTLATIIYKELFNKFKCHSRLNDIRETIKSKGMDHVQSLLISDLTKSSERTVRDSGIEMIRRSCKKKKVLVLLDDVDSRDHLDNLIGGCDFELGSRIIITCRDRALLKSEYKEYELKEMNMKDALVLFRKYAFEGIPPPIELAALSSDIVVTTGRIPLALVIIGSFLKRKDENIWKETLGKLKKVPHMDVQQKLRISYDSLGYDEQQMFVDIACFFIGIDKRIVTYLWKDLHYRLDSGFERMMELSLMKVDDNNKLRMHDHLRDLGRAIACPVGKKLWDCSRLWNEEAITVQRSKEENRNIGALSLDKKGSSMFMKRCTFKRMPYLMFLRLSDVNFVGDFEDSLSELRWLVWEKCPGSFTATNVHLEKLLILDLSGGLISEKWQGWNSIKMEKLKVLNLSRCSHLKSTPNLSALEKLERLTLESCVNLEEIDNSIGDVRCLVSLNLRDCRELEKLPDPELGELKNLEELFIDRTGITKFPECIEYLKKLKMLSAVGCQSLDELPDSIGGLVNLSTLNLGLCCKLDKLPESIGGLKNLQILRIHNCVNLTTLPSTVRKLGKLEELDASGCERLRGEVHIDGMSSLRILQLRETSISGFPEAIDKLSCLEKLDLFSCGMLVSLPQSIGKLPSLQHLDLAYCEKLPSLPKLPASLMVLQVTCRDRTLPRLSHLNHLKELTVMGCRLLESMPELPSGLLKLCVNSCDKLEELPSLSSLEKLQIVGCQSLRSLDLSQSTTHLKHLTTNSCSNLVEIKGLLSLTNLELLEIWNCKCLRSLDLSQSTTHLKRLAIGECSNLVEIKGLLSLTNLELLEIWKCQSLRSLDLSQSTTNLKHLTTSRCNNLVEMKGLLSLTNLEELEIEDCQSLRSLDLSQSTTHMKHLTTSRCSNLVDIRGLLSLTNLEELEIRDCQSLRSLDLSQSTTHLKHLSTRGCNSLVEIKGLTRLRNLESWDHHGCRSLAIPDLSCFPKMKGSHGCTFLAIPDVSKYEDSIELTRLTPMELTPVPLKVRYMTS